ncbi:hypothetical protein C3007_01985 [Avibacterium gallinarum]|uniref:Uncharacterized protein n=1 Tax=Avibacterium gallinarum TaxID=755 RepID=A0A379AVY1_AVIGA|nr:hypothetical protein [Avibacterium gallinarum]POY45027.1 hypothetical protein C3007_01985 [Avibacterium gallinarum]TDP28854.1 hypothetical protein EV689_104118 [Avibacterium gallinarum]SUB26363.1 Uncharacterised protein [Avibacterium gallinarum]
MIVSICNSFISIIAVIVSICSYKKSTEHQKKSNDLSALNVVTQLQIEISKKQLSLIDQEIRTKEDKLKLKAKIEDLLNLFELLSIYILKSDLDKNLMKVIYKDVITQTVEENKEYFGTTTKYRNLEKLYKEWTKEREITLP